jgi:hypothetical protein
MALYSTRQKDGRPRGARVVTSTQAWCPGMRDPSDMTMLHGVVRVDGRW